MHGLGENGEYREYMESIMSRDSFWGQEYVLKVIVVMVAHYVNICKTTVHCK